MKKIIALAAILSLSSCTSAPGKGEGEGAENDSSTRSPLPLELAASTWGNEEGLHNLAKAFMKAEPEIIIDILPRTDPFDGFIKGRAAEGRLPDIILTTAQARLRDYAERGYLADLSGSAPLARIIEAVLPAVSWGGRQWALPASLQGIGIIYNQRIFADGGLEPPSTWGELEEVCAALKEAGITPFAGLLKSNWSIGHFFSLVHTALMAERGISVDQFIEGMEEGRPGEDIGFGSAVDSSRLFRILDFYRLNMDEYAGEKDWNEQQRDFMEGKAAMMVQGLWAYQALLWDMPAMDCGFVPFPVSDNPSMNRFFADADACFGISSQASEEERRAAMKFLSWLSSPEGISLCHDAFMNPSCFRGDDPSKLGRPYAELHASAASKGIRPWAFGLYPAAVFEDACKTGAQLYLYGRRTGAEVMSGLDEMWESDKARRRAETMSR